MNKGLLKGGEDCKSEERLATHFAICCVHLDFESILTQPTGSPSGYPEGVLRDKLCACYEGLQMLTKSVGNVRV